jgi:hypothetical protein
MKGKELIEEWIAILLVLKGLEEVNEYSYCSLSSLRVVYLISVERKEERFSLPLLTVCSHFRIQLKFESINLFE